MLSLAQAAFEAALRLSYVFEGRVPGFSISRNVVEKGKRLYREGRVTVEAAEQKGGSLHVRALVQGDTGVYHVTFVFSLKRTLESMLEAVEREERVEVEEFLDALASDIHWDCTCKYSEYHFKPCSHVIATVLQIMGYEENLEDFMKLYKLLHVMALAAYAEAKRARGEETVTI